MSESEIHEFTCDRCGRHIDSDEMRAMYFRVAMTVCKDDRPFCFDWPKPGRDLCVDCWHEFLKWWKMDELEQTISTLNERNRRLCVIAREMYKSLLYAPASWEEDEEHCIKAYKDELHELGVL